MTLNRLVFLHFLAIVLKMISFGNMNFAFCGIIIVNMEKLVGIRERLPGWHGLNEMERSVSRDFE